MSNHLYWRLYITQSMGVPTGNWWWHSMSEIEMRATAGGSDQCNGGTATAHNYYNSTYDPAKAFDNNSSTFWGSWAGSQVAGWIKYQFASAVNVAEVAITARNDPGSTNYSPKDFSLQWSDDNSNWTTVGSWSGVSFAQGETKTFRPTVYARNQSKTPYGLLIEAYKTLPYAMQVTAAQSQSFDMPPLIVAQQVATPFALTLCTSQGQPFNMPPLLAAQNSQLYECADLIQQWSLPYDMTIQAAASLEQPFGVAVAGKRALPYGLMVASSLSSDYVWTVEKSLEQPYASQVVAGCGQFYSMALAVQNKQSFAIPFATNANIQPCPIQLDCCHVQPWKVLVAQANTQPLYDTVCQGCHQPWSILWPVVQANGQSFDRTITVTTDHSQSHDLLERNPVVRALSGSWDLSGTHPALRLQGGVRAIYFGVPL